MSDPHLSKLDAVLGSIDSDELVDLVLSLGNIDSPPGHEQPVADCIHDWLTTSGIEASQLGLLPDRKNVIGRVRGTGSGPTLIFNAHMDTAWGPEERRWMHAPDDPVYTSAWRDEDRIVGNGVVNDKGPLACTLIALKAIRASEIALAGDVLCTGVCGEIGMEPVDEFEAPRYLSKEAGARYVIEHGVIGDFAVVAENTNFGITTVEAGKAFFKLTVLGDRSVYTPYVVHTDEASKHANAIVRASEVVSWITKWAGHYERANAYEFEFGTCIPKVGIGAIRAGQPFIPITSPERCFLYLDVRLTPVQSAMQVESELRRGLDEVGVPYLLEPTLYRRGYEAQGVEPLLSVLAQAHKTEFGTTLGGVSSGQCSSWRDTNPFNELGIPAVSYGPSAGMGGAQASTSIADLLHAARMYARIAIGLCG